MGSKSEPKASKGKGKSRPSVPTTNPDAYRSQSPRPHTSRKKSEKTRTEKTTKEDTRKSKSHTHTEKTRSPTTATGTGTGTHRGTSKRAHDKYLPTSASRDVESGRFPSSSVGTGAIDTILLILLIILALSTIIFFIIGVWLLATRNGWPAGLNNTGNLAWTRTISYGAACIILSLFFIPIIAFAVVAAKTRRGVIARISRLFVVFFASLAFLILLMMTITGLFFAANGPGFISLVVGQAWINSVSDVGISRTACRIQEHYKCIGWEDNSCRNCRPTVDGVYGQCRADQRLICPRCFAQNTVINEGQQPQQIQQPQQGQVQQVPQVEQVPQSLPPQQQQQPLIGSPEKKQERIPEPGVPVIITEGEEGSTRTAEKVISPMLAKKKSMKKILRKKSKKRLSLPFTVRSQIPGCKRFVLRRYREFFIPMCIYTIFLAIILIFVAWKSCIDSSPR